MEVHIDFVATQWLMMIATAPLSEMQFLDFHIACPLSARSQTCPGQFSRLMGSGPRGDFGSQLALFKSGTCLRCPRASKLGARVRWL